MAGIAIKFARRPAVRPRRRTFDSCADPAHRDRCDAAFRNRCEPFPADRRLRVPVRLRDHGTRRPRRGRRVAVSAADGFAQRVRRATGPRRRPVPDRSRRRACPRRAPLHPRHPCRGDELVDTGRMARRHRRAADRAVASRARTITFASPGPDRLRRGARAAAGDPLRERPDAGERGLHACLRLRPGGAAVVVYR